MTKNGRIVGSLKRCLPFQAGNRVGFRESCCNCFREDLFIPQIEEKLETSSTRPNTSVPYSISYCKSPTTVCYLLIDFYLIVDSDRNDKRFSCIRKIISKGIVLNLVSINNNS